MRLIENTTWRHVRCCSDYPAGVSNPLEQFVGATNRLGGLLGEGQQEALMQVRRLCG